MIRNFKSGAASSKKRINDLEQVSDENIADESNLALDLVKQTYRVTIGQIFNNFKTRFESEFNPKIKAAQDAADKAQTTADAKVNKSDDWHHGAKQIQENFDLHSLLDESQVGHYLCLHASISETLKNCPTDKAFHLEMHKSYSTHLIVREYATNRIWSACHYDNSWSKWVLQYNEQNKPSLDDLDMSTLLDKMFPVGHLLTTFNTANPSTYGYPGTWEKVANDLTLMFGSTPNKTASGTNTPTVPVPLHHHDATFEGDEMEEHGHTVPTNPSNTSGSGAMTAPVTSKSYSQQTSKVSAGTPTGKVTIANSGIENATIDVRGKHIVVIGWIRTA